MGAGGRTGEGNEKSIGRSWERVGKGKGGEEGSLKGQGRNRNSQHMLTRFMKCWLFLSFNLESIPILSLTNISFYLQ